MTDNSPQENEFALTGDANDVSDERPPLPSRLSALDVLQKSKNSQNLGQRPKLTSQPTTALSSTVIPSQNMLDEGLRKGSLKTSSSRTNLSYAARSIVDQSDELQQTSNDASVDTASIYSLAQTVSGLDAESLLGDVLNLNQQTSTWKLQVHSVGDRLSTKYIHDIGEPLVDFDTELDDVEMRGGFPLDEEQQIIEWKSKRKQFLILSQSGKPIWQRHGSDNLISTYIGAIQTIVSLYESTDDNLRTFTAGGTRFVVLTRLPLYLVGISKLGESELQLRAQLDALYMQILSTLTFPTLSRLFSLRPSTDLRRPLQGTENLLSALADSFTRGSPSTLLGSLECLKLQNQQRQAINDVLLKHRHSQVLYGLIVAGGKLVSVVRPKTHSLHPGDLQLIFNMLFEADGIQAGGGENWIPICLPGFNKNGFLYMYVSYIDEEPMPSDVVSSGVAVLSEMSMSSSTHRFETRDRQTDRVAVLLISGRKESFFELQASRNAIVKALKSTALLQVVRRSLRDGRSRLEEIAPGRHLRHFIYKSRENLQLVMSAWDSEERSYVQKRQLTVVYEHLHTNLHRKGAQLKTHHTAAESFSGIASMTDSFEFYGTGQAGTSKKTMTQSLNKIVQWIKKREDQLFIIGGAIF